MISTQDNVRVNGVAEKSALLSCPPSSSGGQLPEVWLELRRRILAFLEKEMDDEVLRNVQSQARVSIRVIEEALERYGPEQLSLSYNGGKDCLVLLVLILACLPTYTASSTRPDANTTPPTTLQSIYISCPNPFPEVEDFVASSAAHYHLDLTCSTLPMRAALESYLQEKPSIKAIFVGTRRTDPHGELLKHFDPTDKDWPQFTRINAVIDWHYTEIWTFIRSLDIPYCDLYNQGFTSLGSINNTHPNPALALDNNAQFRPAYELVDDDKERWGRYSLALQGKEDFSSKGE
ncbi:hypothetical protein AJ80_01257 [Polytolypa hystricis UAMH7299]|uniref:FAD synthase n=1 Tax=Polytolypa hystricis (strain UAMH7299) TaxID=1447883 RepID=A0A2B7Z166_POLH7|nr:hypothetical protein AJ80_01257 [Polytolypa hystricis UAMH7299]